MSFHLIKSKTEAEKSGYICLIRKDSRLNCMIFWKCITGLTAKLSNAKACRFRTLQDGIRQFYAGKIPGRPFCRRNDAQRRIRRMPVRTCGVLALRPYDGGIQSDTVEGAFVRRFGYSRNPGRRYRIVRAERFESQCAAGFGAGASSGTGNRGVIVIQKIYIILKKY